MRHGALVTYVRRIPVKLWSIHHQRKRYRFPTCFLKNNEENKIMTLLHVLARKIMTL